MFFKGYQGSSNNGIGHLKEIRRLLIFMKSGFCMYFKIALQMKDLKSHFKDLKWVNLAQSVKFWTAGSVTNYRLPLFSDIFGPSNVNNDRKLQRVWRYACVRMEFKNTKIGPIDWGSVKPRKNVCNKDMKEENAFWLDDDTQVGSFFLLRYT